MEKKYGLIGHPVKESGSPGLFRQAYEGKYRYDLIEGEDFEESYQKFIDEYQAVNVTAPFKQAAFGKAVALTIEGKGLVSGPCFKIRAANILLKSDEGIEAHNSDFTGIILSVAEAYFPGLTGQCYAQFGNRGHIKAHQFFKENIRGMFMDKPQALIVGCGGAGRAAAVAAAELGFDVALMNRSPEKAQELAAEMPEYGFIAVPMSDFRNSVRECELVIYTIPNALDTISGLSEEDFAGENPGTNPPKVILEANYKTPAFSGEVLARLNAGGCKYVSGKQWLAYQALTGYGIMTGEEPYGFFKTHNQGR